ncbi:MAG: radical SAM protein [Candidatus Hydrogenedens sp.]|nr:radical SAM protein [Candidatus Hydrogenedens sp.]
MNYVFGPVYSRRLGKSLGIDTVPFKTCSQDCIYCQLGPTTCKSLERASFCSPEVIIKELLQKLQTSKTDYITLAGSGEPTLCLELGQVISKIKKVTSIPVVVLTNGLLMSRQEVREELKQADVVCPSLDAGNEYVFQRVNRPVPGIDFDTFLNGLIEFRKEYEGQIWLEVLLVRGITDTKDEVIQIAQCSARINPDRIHLNTVTRPPADSSISGLTVPELEEFSSLFTPTAEVIAEYPAGIENNPIEDEKIISANDILEILQRHPCSITELSFALNTKETNIHPLLKDLLHQKRIESFNIRGRELYRFIKPE